MHTGEGLTADQDFETYTILNPSGVLSIEDQIWIMDSRLAQIIIFTLAVGFFIIALHQTMTFGFAYSYWIFMLSAALLLLYKIRKDKANKS